MKRRSFYLYAQSFPGLNPTIESKGFWIHFRCIVCLYQFASEWGIIAFLYILIGTEETWTDNLYVEMPDKKTKITSAEF